MSLAVAVSQLFAEIIVPDQTAAKLLFVTWGGGSNSMELMRVVSGSWFLLSEVL